MKLSQVRVRMFQNVVDSTPAKVCPDVTALVGKNESGKTAFLQALYRLNPVYPQKTDDLSYYPRWRRNRDRRDGLVAQTNFVEVEFVLSDEDDAHIEKTLGLRFPPKTEIVASRDYSEAVRLAPKSFDERQVIQKQILKPLLPEDRDRWPSLVASKTVDELVAATASLHQLTLKQGNETGEEKDEREQSALERLKALKAGLDGLLIKTSFKERLSAVLKERMPVFFYFGQYSLMKGRIDLQNLQQLTASFKAEPGKLDDADRTALSLLTLAECEPKDLLGIEYEARRAELEAAANEITSEVFEFWTQNRDLRVTFDVEAVTEQNASGQNVVNRYLQVRIYDERHQMTTNFDVRSSGFRWLFSFIAAFKEYQEKAQPIVVLLDEPGLGLHARAQGDFLRFIHERLAKRHQVIYSTHSPFMIDADLLEQVRVVEDSEDLAIASTVTTDVLSRDRDTLFPLQAALGYDIAQNLFIGRNNLIVEGTSDIVYLKSISRYLENNGRNGLDPRWRYCPAGSVSNVATFVALLGYHLPVTVLVDSAKHGHQRLNDLIDRKILDAKRLIAVGQVTGESDADIEDLFDESWYLQLYNEAFSASLKSSDLKGKDRIVKRIERHIESKFDHDVPAITLLERKGEYLPKLSSNALDRFEELMKLINATVEPEAPKSGG